MVAGAVAAFVASSPWPPHSCFLLAGDYTPGAAPPAVAAAQPVAPYLFAQQVRPGESEPAAAHRSAAEAQSDVTGQLQLEGSVDAAPMAAARHKCVVPPERPGPPFAAAAAAEWRRSGDPSLSVVGGQ